MKKFVLILLILFIFLPSHSFADKKKKKTFQPPPPLTKPDNGSLFSDSARNLEVLIDLKPRQIGDIVFIDIVESNSASVSSSAKSSRQSGAVGGALLGLAPIPPEFVPGAGSLNNALGSRKFDGKGATERSSQLRARVAARVVEVLPNGDLRVEAEKRTKINRETEKLILSGYVRVRDISNENSIVSTSVADLKVTLNGKGIASNDNGTGWLVRLIEKYSPF